jgi:hypothetical protein
MRLFVTVSQANETNGFCYNDTACLNILAVCKNDSTNPNKFCQCPSSDYITNMNTQQCGK